ncbi:MAG: ankyrin repeat domain-containing protein, partial [Sphingobacteriales bacterium]
GHADATKLLLKAGADANRKTGDGITPLQIAKDADEKGLGDGYETVKLLLKNGAEEPKDVASE